MKTISVIIPVYNAADSVADAVDSLVAQDYEGLEIILVNDGSTDGSGETCDELRRKFSCITVIHKANGGVSSARNAGLDAASGDYVMFLDADDVLAPGCLKEMSAADSDMVLGGFRKITDGAVTEEHVPVSAGSYSANEGISAFLDDVIGEKDCYLLNSSCFKLYRRALIAGNDLRFDEELRYGEDKMFVFSFLCHMQTATTVPAVVYDYLIRSESLSSDVVSDSHINQILLLLERYVGILDRLVKIYPRSVRLAGLYHMDVVCRYVFRILTCFATRKSSLMTMQKIALLYSYMDKDDLLGMLSIRVGQIPNYLLYLLRKPALAMKAYSFSSSICRYIFRR